MEMFPQLLPLLSPKIITQFPQILTTIMVVMPLELNNNNLPRRHISSIRINRHLRRQHNPKYLPPEPSPHQPSPLLRTHLRPRPLPQP